MPPALVVDDDLVHRLPLPLAQLYRRGHNAKSALERHQTAFYLWEAALKLLGSVCVVEYAALPTHAPELAECLQNLARPALGHWWEFVRRLIPVLADQAVPGFAPLRDLLLGKRRDDLPRAAGLNAALRQVLEGTSGARAAVYPAELFDRLVRYRNREIGHGAAGMASGEVYERLGQALLAGTAELLRRLDVLAGRRLVYVSEVREVRGSWKVERLELAGEAPRRLEPLEQAREQAAGLPSGERLYLAEAGADGSAGRLTSLHPLVVFDAEANECAFLNGRRGKARAEYLCYSSGRTTERPDLGDEQRALLARALGLPAVSAEQAGAWAARSQAEDPAVEPAGEGREPAVTRRTLGEYELLSELGRGGMGVVYRAWQPALGRQVALKCLARPGDPRAEARFRREIRALGRVEHPHLVKVFTSGSDGEQWFYVMELVEGVPLAAVCDKLSTAGGGVTAVDLPAWQVALGTAVDEQRRQEKPLSDPPAAEPVGRVGHPSYPTEEPPHAAGRRGDRGYADRMVALVRQAAEAAEALHRHGIVHRDVKPGNILVDAAGERATLMDLGLAQVADDVEGKLTRTRQFVGTLRYASPEQVLAVAPVDGRSDVYGLGATLWELLALQPLFGATEATPTPELMQTIQRDEPQRLRSIHPGLARDLEAVVHKCLEKKPSDRYTTARELADDLGRYLEGESVRARPASWLDRRLKWVRRHPKEAAAYGLGLLTAVLLLIGGTFALLWQDAAAARGRSEAARGEAEQAKAAAEDARDQLAAEKRRAEQAIQAKLDAETWARKAKEDEAAALQDLRDEFQYVEAIRRAQHFLESGNGTAGAAELEGTEPKRRHWEWRYLEEGLPRVLAGHAGWVSSVSFSPDGRRLASGSHDSTVRVWDLAGGGAPCVLKGHEGLATSVSFSPDGRHLASGSADSTVRVWDLAGGGAPCVLKGHTDGVWSVSFSPDGRRLASGGGDRKVRVWDLGARGDPQFLEGHTGPVTSVSFSPDGRRLASGSWWDNTVRVWDLAAEEARMIFTGGAARVTSVSFCPNGRWLVSGSADHTVQVWDLGAWGKPGVLRGHTDSVTSVSFSPDGRHLASGSADSTVRVWDLGAWDESRVLKGHTDGVWSVSFSPDGRRLASGSHDSTVRVWDLAGGGAPLVLAGHTGWASSVSFSLDGRHLASGSADRSVRVWDLTTGGAPQVLKGHEGLASSVSFSPDGRRLASGSADSTVRVWDLGAWGEPQVLGRHTDSVTSVAFSPDGRRLASGSADRSVRVWDLATGGVPQVLKGHTGRVSSVSFSPDGRRLASGSHDRTVLVWDLAGGRVLREHAGHAGLVTSVSFSLDGHRLASGGEDRTVRVWDLTTGGAPLVLRGHPGPVWSVSFSPDGRRLASGGEDRTVRVWDLTTGGAPLVLAAHGGRVWSVSFSPDGRRLASRAADEKVRVWETHCRHLWRLRQSMSAEEERSWYAARFHLDWLGREELALQAAEAVGGLAVPTALGGVATFAALQQREGRMPLDDIQRRHYRACLELGDWRGAENDFAWLRNRKADTTWVWHQRAWTMLALARQEVLGVACLVPSQGSSPFGLLLSLWPHGATETTVFRRACAEMAQRFPEPKDAPTRNHLARTRLLVAEGLTEADTARLEQLGKAARDSKPNSEGFLETYGAALYRSGQVQHAAGKMQAADAKFREALDQLDAAVQENRKGGSVWQQCFLAMAHHRLGNDKEARAWLTKAVRQIEAAKKLDWESRVEWHYLRQEAESTLGWRVPPEDKSAPR
jgi:WD40 repeat protein/serine/threonine protein kinase